MSADISLNLCICSCDTCQNSYRNVTMAWKRGVSYWMTPHMVMEKNETSLWTLVIERNTLHNVEDSLSRNQSAPWRLGDGRTRLQMGLCNYASVSREMQTRHVWWMTAAVITPANFNRNFQTIYHQSQIEHYGTDPSSIRYFNNTCVHLRGTGITRVMQNINHLFI